MNRIIASLILLTVFFISGCAQKKGTDYVVTIKTSYGDMVAILYDETPKHKANFIKLAKEKYFDSLLFHRVIPEFMIQGGDPNSKKAGAGQQLGNGGPGYTIEPEFIPTFFHERGALSAARLPDNMNPTKASSGSQFYVVQGKIFDEESLKQMEESMRYAKKNMALRECLSMPEYADVRQQVIDKQRMGDGAWLQSFFEKSDTLIRKVQKDFSTFTFSPAQRERYMSIGGAPHLDGDYTVFGKVIQGLEVIDKIAAVQRDASDRPREDIRMFVTIEEMPIKKIEKTYGYTYPEKK